MPGALIMLHVVAGDEYLRNTKSLLLRANLQKHDFTQRPSQARAPRAAMAERLA